MPLECAGGCGQNNGNAYGDIVEGKWKCYDCIRGVKRDKPKIVLIPQAVVPERSLDTYRPDRFIPKPSWECFHCKRSINMKPLPTCPNPKHGENYEGKLDKQRRKRR